MKILIKRKPPYRYLMLILLSKDKKIQKTTTDYLSQIEEESQGRRLAFEYEASPFFTPHRLAYARRRAADACDPDAESTVLIDEWLGKRKPYDEIEAYILEHENDDYEYLYLIQWFYFGLSRVVCM